MTSGWLHEPLHAFDLWVFYRPVWRKQINNFKSCFLVDAHRDMKKMPLFWYVKKDSLFVTSAFFGLPSAGAISVVSTHRFSSSSHAQFPPSKASQAVFFCGLVPSTVFALAHSSETNNVKKGEKQWWRFSFQNDNYPFFKQKYFCIVPKGDVETLPLF